MHLITFFILILLHTVSKIGMYGLLYILTHSLQVIKYVRLNLSLYLHCNDTFNYVTIHLRLIYIDVSELVILLMTYLMKYVFQTRQKI